MGRIWDAWHATLAVFICMSWTTLAYGQEPVAEEGEGKSVVVIIDSGTADLLLESTVRATTETKLVSEGYLIVQDVQVAGDKPARLLACSGQLACLLEVLSGIPSEYVVFVSMRSDTQDTKVSYKIVARTFEVGTGRVIARTMKRCDACKDELDLAPFAEEVIDQLLSDAKLAKEPKPDVPPTVVDTTADTPKEGAENTQPEFNNVVTTNTNSVHRKRSVLPYVAIGGGISALGTGIALLVLDGPVIENGVRKPEERATSLGGYVMVGTGSALLGLGIWMLVSDSDDESNTTSPIVVAPSSSGAKVLWQGNF